MYYHTSISAKNFSHSFKPMNIFVLAWTDVGECPEPRKFDQQNIILEELLRVLDNPVRDKTGTIWESTDHYETARQFFILKVVTKIRKN